MRLLLLSNSTNSGEKFLDYAKSSIKNFFGEKSVRALFIPYAAVSFSFDEYELIVKERFREIGYDIISVHRFDSPVDAVLSAEAIVVGGGNTFHLLKLLQQNNLLEVVREKVLKGTPYMGWSAGANVACPTICTTNDMPIVETAGFKAFGFVPFQINPHYTDVMTLAHAGETRDQRIEEFLIANPFVTVVGLREGTLFKYENDVLELIGNKSARIFQYNIKPYEFTPRDNFSFLLNSNN